MPNTTMKREPRQEQQARRRRKRTSLDGDARLSVNEELLDFDKYVYRWVHDPARLFSLTKQDDWEVVNHDGELKEDSADLGSAVSVQVGTDKFGKEQMGYLLRKLKTFHEDDQAEAQRNLDDLMAQLSRAQDHLNDDKTNYVRPGQISGVR